jgi:ubiquinol-cytochrome c reductase cytochrome b subunit
VRKHGVAPVPGDELVPPKKFYPAQVFKDTVAIFLAFAILFAMAVAVRVPLEQLADPTDTAYIPRPEWYFLFLFQTLKLFTGPLEVIGTTLLPGLAVLALILVPFIDRGRMVRLTRRTFATAFVALAVLGWTGLTAAAVITTPKQAGEVAVDYSAPTDWMQLSPLEMAGVGYLRDESCIDCHSIGGRGGKIGPDLTRTPIRQVIRHFSGRSGSRPGSAMPPFELSNAQMNSLTAFLLKLNPENATALDNAPEFAVQGALVYQANGCSECHKVNGVGMSVGPALNGLSKRRTRSWVEEHFADPRKLSPGSIMPAFKLSQKDLESLTSYLFALPE